MLPIPIPGIPFLIQSAYPADLVLRACVKSITNLQNSCGGEGRQKAGDPKSRESLKAVGKSPAAGRDGNADEGNRRQKPVVMSLCPSTDEALASVIRRIPRLLALLS